MAGYTKLINYRDGYETLVFKNMPFLYLSFCTSVLLIFFQRAKPHEKRYSLHHPSLPLRLCAKTWPVNKKEKKDNLFVMMHIPITSQEVCCEIRLFERLNRVLGLKKMHADDEKIWKSRVGIFCLCGETDVHFLCWTQALQS